MKKILVVLVVACITMSVFAGFKANIGLGLQSSIGGSYEYENIEVGADLRSFYPAYALKIAKATDEPNNPITWFGGDAYALYKVCEYEGFSAKAGIGFMNNAYRAANTDRTAAAKETNWAVAKETNLYPFQTKEYTFMADLKLSYDFTKNHAVSLFAEFPVLGVSRYKTTSASQAFSFMNYLTSCARLARIEYTYSF